MTYFEYLSYVPYVLLFALATALIYAWGLWREPRPQGTEEKRRDDPEGAGKGCFRSVCTSAVLAQWY